MASLSFSCFQTLFSKPCRHCNAVPNSGPKPRTGFRILSKPGSSSSDDFGLISTAERSDGSIVFRFGNARDVVVEKAESSSGQANSLSEKPGRRKKAQASGGEVKGVVVVGGVLGPTISLLEENSKGRSAATTLCSDEVTVDIDDDDVAAKDSSLEAVAIDSDVDGVTASSVSSGLDSDSLAYCDESTDTDVAVTNTPDEATAETSLGEGTIRCTLEGTGMSETSLDRETRTSNLVGCVDPHETENSMQLGHNEFSTNEEEVKVSEEERNTVEELPVEETPNGEEISTRELVLSSGAALLRHPSEGLASAEDAYFVACQNWLGVADGVGQWSLQGISSELYAQELMENCERIISDFEDNPVANPGEVLVRSVAETESPGSSTILVARFDGQAFHVANIGDSGFMIIRDGYVFHQSSPTVHEFNFPLHIERGDDPSNLFESYKIDLDEGDVIITATDGLFDNLYDQEIASFVLKSLKAGREPQDIAEALANKAQEVARSSSSRTPFADSAQAAGYMGYSGGKLDDVAIIVSLVRKMPGK